MENFGKVKNENKHSRQRIEENETSTAGLLKEFLRRFLKCGRPTNLILPKEVYLFYA